MWPFGESVVKKVARLNAERAARTAAYREGWLDALQFALNNPKRVAEALDFGVAPPTPDSVSIDTVHIPRLF
jgi:hypothetical protein